MPTNRHSTTHMLPQPQSPWFGTLTLGLAQRPPTPTHFDSGNAVLGEAFTHTHTPS